MRIDGDTMIVFGGVYGNAHALEALQKAEPDVKTSAMVCAGDLAAYCADGSKVCGLMRRDFSQATIIRGNCERTLSADDGDCGCGYASGSACETLSVAWYAHARADISDNDKTWMGSLPSRATLEFGGRVLAAFHADIDSDNRFIFASTPAEDKQRSILALGADGVITGHSGIPFTDNIDGKLWHNSGALGMPANDGTPRVWYSRWTAKEEGIYIEHCALDYDVSAAQASMIRAGLPDEYRLALETGIWPSDDILPPAERAQQGSRLSPETCFWPR